MRRVYGEQGDARAQNDPYGGSDRETQGDVVVMEGMVEW